MLQIIYWQQFGAVQHKHGHSNSFPMHARVRHKGVLNPGLFLLNFDVKDVRLSSVMVQKLQFMVVTYGMGSPFVWSAIYRQGLLSAGSK